MSMEDLLQKRIEQLEAGTPLESCLAELPHEEAELLELVATLREMPHPLRDAQTTANQRGHFVSQIQSASPLATARARASAVWNWLRPRPAFAGAVATLVVCALIALAAVQGLGPFAPDRDATQPRATEPSVETVVVADPTPEPPVPTDPPEAPGEKIEETDVPGAPLAEATLKSPHEVYLPVLSSANRPAPARATLQEVRGLVEIRGSEGTWRVAGTGLALRAGQRLRTGALSSALLTFHDGSQARLGPETELSVEELDARVDGGPRIVALTQWSGDTEHTVAPANDASSRYEVHTPSATGVAKGTVFRVRVTARHAAHFSVDEGVVAVTGQEVTVDVGAGQTTMVDTEQAPDAPTFRITGEGEVTAIGPTWTIAGHLFETHEGTVIVGNPQVGDWVFVEGTQIADWIQLLRRSPLNRFSITGRVGAIGATEWTVAGQAILVDDETDIDADIVVDDLVSVEGVILDDGSLLAQEIHRIDEAPGQPFAFTGVVQAIADETWTISGVTVSIDNETVIDQGIVLGDIVEVQGLILDDDTWLAQVIELAEPVASDFEFTGVVDSIDPWMVAGISFETDEWTEIEADIQVGDLVRVEGQILADGTWLASEIALLDDDGDQLSLVFVGVVDSTDPWQVSGLPLAVDDQTVIDADIVVGDLVRVSVSIMPDGTWLATSIERLDVDGDVQGCLTLTAVVLDVGDNWIEVPNWPTIDLNGVTIVGQLQVGSVVLMQVCVGADGAIDIVTIVVIHQPAPVVPPAPQPPPPGPPPPDSPPPHGDERVTICHKPGTPAEKTLTVSQSALDGHLSHGDTQGPCP
jgi:hypothetical protein